ncbi:MAG: sigma-E processing peptidase SpoIIGA [Oscillospiraceae bacterium]|nr:sigma-E processing peptidase SpoIIGA [Oscillospiraceae bacterium]
MAVYWDLAALWDLALDYLLLLGAARLAGHGVKRLRLAASAALGAAYSVAALALKLPTWTLVPALIAVCALAYAGTGRTIKLTLLFAALACALAGAVFALGSVFGSVERLARCLLCARIPWGVFLAAAGLSYAVQSVVFRGGARHGDCELVNVRVYYRGRSVDLKLFKDTGNTLSDPMTGEGVPVIEREAISPLFEGAEDVRLRELHCSTVGGTDTVLETFRCDELKVGSRSLGARLIALSSQRFDGRYRGLWFSEEKEEATKNELEAAVG